MVLNAPDYMEHMKAGQGEVQAGKVVVGRPVILHFQNVPAGDFYLLMNSGGGRVHQFRMAFHEMAFDHDGLGGGFSPLQVAVGDASVFERDFVVVEFVVVLVCLDAQEDHRAEHGDGLVPAVFLPLVHFQAGPGQDIGDAGGDQDNRIKAAQAPIQPVAGPGAGIGADAQKNVGREQRAEEHDFGGQEQPDADLRVVKAGVRPAFNCVGDFHAIQSPGFPARFAG